MSTQPYKCPVCLGTGGVAEGFYSSTSGVWSSTGTQIELCRSCFGSGIVWRTHEESTKDTEPKAI